MYAADDCESKLDKFYSMIDKLIEEHVPLHKRDHSDFPSWFSKDLKSSIFEKNKAHHKFKLSWLESDNIKFKKLRAECVRKSRVCYAEYLDKVQSSIIFNLKSLWSYVDSKRKILDIPGSVFLTMLRLRKVTIL